jgi:hypothetical protein
VGISTVPVWMFDANARAHRLTLVQAFNDDAIEAAQKAGFDLSLVDASLKLSLEERAKQHDQALSLVLEFDRIRQARSAKPESTSPAVS